MDALHILLNIFGFSRKQHYDYKMTQEGHASLDVVLAIWMKYLLFFPTKYSLLVL